MAAAKELRLNNPKEFRQMFEGMMTPDTRVGFLQTTFLEIVKVIF